jgi:prepilin-type N-terminal cleavage/methylation domain-containing protein
MTRARRLHHSSDGPGQRGFTVVELMMSLAVLVVGIGGIIAMQKVTVSTNLHAKSLATATRIAQAWQDQLMTEGSLWTQSTGITNTTWLKFASSSPGTWVRPTWTGTVSSGNGLVQPFGAAFDALGNPLVDASVAQAHFCVHILLQPVYPIAGRLGMIRTTVRVLWPRVQGTYPTTNFCATTQNPALIGAEIENYHSIYQTSAVRVRR